MGKNDGWREENTEKPVVREVVHCVFIRIRDFHVTLSHETTTQPLKVIKDHLACSNLLIFQSINAL